MSWKSIELAKVCEVFADGDWIESKDQSATGIRLIQTGNVGFGKFKARDSKARYINEETFKKLRCTEIKEGDILISRLPDPVGRACIVPQLSDKSITAVDCTIIRTKEEILGSNYLNYYCQSPHYFEQIKKNITGATRQRISRSLLGKTVIPIAPVTTQQKIVAKLDAIFAEIETALAAAEANANNAEALFQSYLTEVFEQGSKSWREIKIKELGKVVTGNTPKTNEPENYGNYISFVKPGDFKGDGSIDLEKQKLSLIGMNKSRVVDERSALMVCIGATIGKCGYTETKIVTNQQVNSVTPTEQFNHVFIYLQMLTNDFQTRVKIRSGQATLPIINKSKWESLTLKFPSLSDQIKIVNRFNILRAESDNFRNSQLDKINALNKLKQSILLKAFSGELVKD